MGEKRFEKKVYLPLSGPRSSFGSGWSAFRHAHPTAPCHVGPLVSRSPNPMANKTCEILLPKHPKGREAGGRAFPSNDTAALVHVDVGPVVLHLAAVPSPPSWGRNMGAGDV